jgi:hypothetical protein
MAKKVEWEERGGAGESHDWGHNGLTPWSEEELNKTLERYSIRNRI